MTQHDENILISGYPRRRGEISFHSLQKTVLKKYQHLYKRDMGSLMDYVFANSQCYNNNKIQIMYRNGYQPQQSFSSQPRHSQFRHTASTGFGQRAPLYPIGPTLTQPSFNPIQRGVSPSPYLNREGMAPPSYEERFLRKAESLAGQNNISYEEREKRLIERNEREIEQQQKRRDQIRISFERQINTLSAKLNRNMQSKQKLLTEIDTLQHSHDELHDKLMSVQPPEKNSRNNFESIDRKQQQMIILKNKLIGNMRENQTDLYKKQEEEEKYWEEQIAQKDKVLFKLEQDQRDKRLELHMDKQKSLEKPDFLSLEEEVRAAQYEDFIHKYEGLESKIKNMVEERERSAKQVRDMLEIKKPQLHNLNVRRAEVRREFTDLKLRVEQLSRVSKEMESANDNLMKELERKEEMIGKYELDIHELRSLKEQTESDITCLLNEAREREEEAIFGTLAAVISKAQEDSRFEQTSNAKLKNQYQKLYELLCSSTSKNIHQTFSETIVSTTS